MKTLKVQLLGTEYIYEAIQYTKESITLLEEFLSKGALIASHAETCSLVVNCSIVGAQRANFGDYIVKYSDEDYIVELPEQFEKLYKIIDEKEE